SLRVAVFGAAEVRVWDLQDQTRWVCGQEPLPGHVKHPYGRGGAVTAQDGTSPAIGDGVPRIYDEDGGNWKERLPPRGHIVGALGVAFVDEKTLISAGNDQTLLQWTFGKAAPRDAEKKSELVGPAEELAYCPRQRLLVATLGGPFG